MVEKWLVEVEESMLSNVRKVISDSVKDYANTPRKKWVISWPGQVVICCSSIYWTTEVTEAMKMPRGMDVSLATSPSVQQNYKNKAFLLCNQVI